MKKKETLGTGLVLFLSLAAPNAVAQLSSSVLPQELNATQAQEALNNDLVVIASKLQGQTKTLTPDQVTGSATGTITATGWKLTFEGTLLGTSISITQVGSLNNAVRTWTDTGSVGEVPLTGSGSLDDSGKMACSINWGSVLGTILTVGVQAAVSVATEGVATKEAIEVSIEVLTIGTLSYTVKSSSSVSSGHYLGSSSEYNGSWAITATGVLDEPTGNASLTYSLTPAGIIVWTPTGSCFPGGPLLITIGGSPGPTFPEPPCGDLPILSVPSGLALTSSVVTTTGGPWLTGALNQSVTPATLSLSANAASLSPGTYNGTVTVSAQQAINSPIVVPVTLTVMSPPTTALPATEITQLFSTGTVCSFTTTTNSLNATTGGITGSQTNVASSACSVPSGVYNLTGGQTTVAPNQVEIPQVAVNGLWNTQIVVSNTTAFAGSFTLNCYQETSNNATQPWTLAFADGSNSAQTFSVAGGASKFLETAGVSSAALIQGDCHATMSPGLQAYALFTEGNSEIGTSPGATAGDHFLVPYNSTFPNNSEIAWENPTASITTISVSFQTDSGQFIPAAPVALPPGGHAAFQVATSYPATAGTEGLMEVTSTGNIAVIALDATGSAFSTGLVYSVGGPNVISPAPLPDCWLQPFQPGCLEPPWDLLLLDSTISTNPVHVAITPANGTYTAQVSGTNNGVAFAGSFVGGTITATSPVTFTFTSVGSGFSGGSLTLTLTPTAFDASRNVVVGTYSGTATLGLPGGSGGGTLRGAISGSYTALIPPPQTAVPTLTISLQATQISTTTAEVFVYVANSGSTTATNVKVTAITAITAAGSTLVYAPGLPGSPSPPFAVPGATALSPGNTSSSFILDFTATQGSAQVPFSFVVTVQADNVAPFSTTINVVP
jgi:hypothetical protein